MRCNECGEDRELHRSDATGTDICDECEAVAKKKFQQWVERNVESSKQREDAKAQENVDLVMNLARGQGIMAGVERLHELKPFFVDENRLLWVWDTDRCTWLLSDDLPNRPVELITIMKGAMKLVGDSTVRHEALLSKAVMQIGLIRRPKTLDLDWIQFGTRLHNIRTGETRPSTPDVFVANAVPWTIGASAETPTIDKLFASWVGEEYVPTMHEILAYSLYRDYPVHSIIALTGSGRNGKSSFLRLQKKFLGADNVASTNLDRLQTNRFETFNLYKKLVAVMGETDFAILQQTSLIKQLVGQDLIPFEKKGGSTFSSQNYAKLVLATNSLPSSNDTSEGFYRRWLIIDFPNEYPEGPDILATIPEEEYSALARRAAITLSAVLARNSFTNQGSIEERKNRYIAASNPLVKFIAEHCKTDESACVRFSLLYMKYAQWLGSHKKRVVKKKEFTQVLENEGYEIRKTSVMGAGGVFENGYFVFGLEFSDQGFEFGRQKPSVTNVTDVTELPLNPLYRESDYKHGHISHIAHIAPITAEFDFPTKYDVLESLQALQAEKQGSAVSFEDLEKVYPGFSETVQERLTKAAAEGEVFEPRPGHWLRL